MDLRRQYFSRSSSHGVENSIPQPPTQPCTSHLISSMTESNRQHNLCMIESAREIRESCERILKLLQEEIDATKSTNDVRPTSDNILPFVEQIEEHSITNESVQVKNSIVTSIPLDETLPSMEPFEKQSAADESGVVRTSMVEAWTPICEILGKPLVSSPLLIQDASYTVSDGFDLTYGIVANPPPTPEPPDRVEIATVRNSNSFANDLGIWLTLRPPEKPPDFDLSTLNFVEENRYGFSTNGVCPASGLTSLHVIVKDKLYHISSVTWVSFIECLIIEFVSPIVVIISGCEFSGVIVNIINVLYTKQGDTNNAFNIFDILSTQTIVTLAGLMNGSARICMHKLASGLFEEMVQLGNHNAYSTYEHMDVENYVFVKMPLAINFTYHTLNHSLIVMQCHVSLTHADFDTSGTLERAKFLLNEKLGMVSFDFQFVELMAWLIIIDDGSTYSGLVLRRLVDKCTWLLGSKFMLSVYLHSVDVGRIVQNLLGRFTVLGSDQSLGYNLCTPMLVATILTTCSTHIFSHHVLEAPTKCFIECLELNCININILIDPFLGIASLVVVQKLKRVNEKGILKVISQHKVLFTSVHQNVTCRICCYYDFGSNALVLFGSNALEIHLPQCTRNCLDMDCFSNLTFAEETTNFVAFLRYVHSSPIWCHDIKSSCIVAKDDFSAIIARLGLLYGVVTSNLQWYLNCQCTRFCKTSICNMHVMLLGILLSLPNSQVPYSELIFGPCGYNLNGRWFGVTQVLAYQAWHAKLSLVQVQVFASAGHPKTWDPGGGDYFFHTKGSLQFKQWDPGGNV